MKRLVYILCIVILLLSCSRSNIYQIEGRLSNLTNTTLYVVYESSEGNMIDTVLSDEQGQFLAIREYDENIRVITVYYNGRENWFKVYPEVGKSMQIRGDAKYPKLLQVKGGRTNNKLSEFKKKATPLLKELTDIDNNRAILSNGEDVLHLANINHELHRITKDFIKANPEEEASAILISEYFASYNEIEQHTENMLDQLSPTLNDFFIVRHLRAQINKAKTTIVGAKAPDFNVTNIYGQTFTADSFANKHFILAFTASWCDMCQTEVMMLDNIVTKYPKDSIDVLLISLDYEFDETRKVIHQDSINWNFVADSAGQAINLFETYNVNSLPKCYLIDKDRRIILRTTNGIELQHAVDEIMK